MRTHYTHTVHMCLCVSPRGIKTCVLLSDKNTHSLTRKHTQTHRQTHARSHTHTFICVCVSGLCVAVGPITRTLTLTRTRKRTRTRTNSFSLSRTQVCVTDLRVAVRQITHSAFRESSSSRSLLLWRCSSAPAAESMSKSCQMSTMNSPACFVD